MLLNNRFAEDMNKITERDCIIFDKINHYDIVSSYPTSMVSEAVPICKPIMKKFNKLINIDEEGFGFYQVEVMIPESAIGLYYHKLSHKLQTKAGTYTLILSSHEIKYFEELGEIKVLNYIDGLIFEKTEIIFKD
jgi:hypothetical protein